MPEEKNLANVKNQLPEPVYELVEEMLGHLEITQNPEWQAYRSLVGQNRYGWTEVPYNDRAFKIWGDSLRRNHEDITTLHHLAIMHHARAFDLEMGSEPQQADQDWQTALDYWYRLWANDTFWERLAGKLSPDQDQAGIIARIKHNWAEHLLQIHLGIACDPATKKQRISYHVRLVLESTFPEAIKERVRALSYENWARAKIESQVWAPDMLTPEILEEGLKQIKAYLERDPGCIPALGDVLRLQLRLVTAWHQQIMSLNSEDPVVKDLFQTISQNASQWEPYLRQLLVGLEKLDHDLREKLCAWYRRMGEVRMVVKQFSQAATFFENAIAAADQDEDRLDLDRRLGETLALEVRELAGSSNPEDERRAKEMCDRVRRRPHLSLTAIRFLANAYMLIREHDLAEEVCRQALARKPDSLTLEELTEIEEQKADIEELMDMIQKARKRQQVESLLEQAVDLLKNDRFDGALRFIDEALQLDPERGDTLILKCQCHLGLFQAQEAKNALDSAKYKAKDKELSEIFQKLEKDIQELGKIMEDWGQEGWTLYQKAVKAFNREDFDEAERWFRQAVDKARPTGKRKAQQDLEEVQQAKTVKEMIR
jgi:tetratricopeptide (TPR) repeat protein